MNSAAFSAEFETLTLPRFEEWAALSLGLALIDSARVQGAPVTIDIRTSDRILFHAVMPGTRPLNERWIERKARTALLFQEPSYIVGLKHREKGQTLAHHGLSLEEYADHGGAVPIKVEGTGVVAVVTISGLAGIEDHRMAVTGLRGLKAQLAGDFPKPLASI